MAFAGRRAPGRDLVLERLPRYGSAPEGDRRHGRNRYPHGRWRGALGNISGTNHPLVELERELAGLHSKEAALVFTSGYVSNETSIATIAGLLPNCVILSDALNDNSMIEGVRRADVEKERRSGVTTTLATSRNCWRRRRQTGRS
jgi:Aminotransferase class I and II